MKLSRLGEFGLIEKIRKSSVRFPPSVLIGIGDDAAALRTAPSRILLVTTDMLLEDVHFDLCYTDFYSLGWKAAAANLSDIAAMGGIPRYCLTSLGLPPQTTVEQTSAFFRGFNALMKAHETRLVGGDTCSSTKGTAISIVVLGEIEKKNLLSRAGARPGDAIFVTGALGDSAAGLELLQSGSRGRGAGVAALIQKHLRPEPRVEWGRTLARSGCVNAMIDISDGLSSDLIHVCEQSRVGAEIHSDRIPISPALKNRSNGLAKPAVAYALSGGEDYELLFTVPPRKKNKARSLDVPMTEIGIVHAGRALVLVDGAGNKHPLRRSGFDHFRRTSVLRNVRSRTLR